MIIKRIGIQLNIDFKKTIQKMMECYRSFSGANNNFQLPIYDQILTLMFFAASSRTFLRLSGRVKRPVIVRLLCHTFLRLSLKDTSRLEVTIKLQMAKFSSICPEYAKCSFWKCLVQKLLPNNFDKKTQYLSSCYLFFQHFPQRVR